MEDIGKTVMHSTMQLALGIVVGGVCDATFPPAPEQHELDGEALAWLSAEVILQIIANGLITAGVVKGLDKLSPEIADPTGALAYGWSLQAAQPQLMQKIKLLGRHVSSVVSSYEKAALSQDTPTVGATAGQKQRLKERTT